MSLHDWVIYQLVDSRTIGGIESHILNVSSWLVRNGYRCEVIFLKNYGEHPLKEQLDSAGVHWQTLEHFGSLYQRLHHSPCLLATHGYKAGILGRFIATLCKVPVVSTYHSGDKGTGKLRWYSKLDEITAYIADHVVTVSADIAARIPVKTTQLPNFVEPQHVQTVRGKEIAFVGRLSHEKGPDIFANVTASVLHNAPIVVYGDGPLKSSLQHQHPHITFKGQVDMKAYWRNISLLCITSRQEGLPLAALEAMSMGIPVICFALGALPTLIEHNKNGWLIKCGDTGSFQTELKCWLQKSDLEKAAISIAASHTINQRFSSDVVMPRLLGIYRDTIRKRGGFPLKIGRGEL